MFVVEVIDETIKAINPKHIAFKDISTQYLINTFHIKRIRKSPILQEWLDMPYEISEKIKQRLEQLRDKLDLYGAYYNEGELKWKFLNPLITLVDYDESEAYDTFIERTIQATLEGKNLRGIVDFILATGEVESVEPFFFVHEYKKEKGTADDVIGQLLRQSGRNNQPFIPPFSLLRNSKNASIIHYASIF
ncbi:MAG: hypothetical protein AB8G86_18815 [Saprospiraceae bacterium]